MRNHVKVAVFGVVIAAWLAAMTNWVFFEHIRPDPLTWAIPGTVYLALWPQSANRGGDEPE